MDVDGQPIVSSNCLPGSNCLLPDKAEDFNNNPSVGDKAEDEGEYAHQYELLGLSHLATEEQIRERYFEFALKNHPDKLVHTL
ncbi:hypothetical protein A2U01_0081405, partial [Trifolium medium]|nr:hypothetical protein [Trifolium medium]